MWAHEGIIPNLFARKDFGTQDYKQPTLQVTTQCILHLQNFASLSRLQCHGTNVEGLWSVVGTLWNHAVVRRTESRNRQTHFSTRLHVFGAYFGNMITLLWSLTSGWVVKNENLIFHISSYLCSIVRNDRSHMAQSSSSFRPPRH